VLGGARDAAAGHLAADAAAERAPPVSSTVDRAAEPFENRGDAA